MRDLASKGRYICEQQLIKYWKAVMGTSDGCIFINEAMGCCANTIAAFTAKVEAL